MELSAIPPTVLGGKRKAPSRAAAAASAASVAADAADENHDVPSASMPKKKV